MRDAVRVYGTRTPATHDLVSSYVTAKHEVVRSGYIDEIAWQGRTRVADVDHISFTREAAWVVLSAGMREQVVRSLFERLGEALHRWDPQEITRDDRAAAYALTVFRHEGKINAILSIARTASALTEHELRTYLQEDPQGFLLQLPYVGPVTWAHLAKNLGIPVAKADRHLVRFADAFRRPTVDLVCAEISSWLDEPVSVVDLVLWRYSILHAQHCSAIPCDRPHPLVVTART